jgi:hypothetical protein
MFKYLNIILWVKYQVMSQTFFKKHFFVVLLFLSVRFYAQVVLETEVKISDLGLHFNGSKVGANAPNNNDDSTYDYHFGTSISAKGDCVKTYGNFVFVTWYRGGKTDRHVMLTRYNTVTGTMATIEFPHRHTGYLNQWWIGEAHNAIAIGISPIDGTIHLLYDMHAYSGNRPSDGSFANDYFRYSYSIPNTASLPDAEFTLDKFVQSSNGMYKHLKMPGDAPQSEFLELTYPHFFLNDDGNLFMWMRRGGHTNGMYKFIRYDASSGTWGDFVDFNSLNARSQPGIDRNWGLYGTVKYENGKIRIGFQRRLGNSDDKYWAQNGVYYAYSDNQDGVGGWKNHRGESFDTPLYDSDFIKVIEPGDYVETTQKGQVRIVDGFDWSVTDNEDVHIISKVKDLENNVTKYLHTYKPSGAMEFITSEDFSGGEAVYTSGNSVFLIGLNDGRVFVEKAEGGTNNFTRVYQATTGKRFRHGRIHIANGKAYYYLMERMSGSAQPLYLQIIDLDIEPTDPTLPNNFTIQAIGETCIEKENGKIVITSAATNNYIVKIDDATYNFTKNKTIESLSPGTYNLCITLDDEDFEQCYQVIIAKAETLSGKIDVSSKSVDVAIQSGTAPYSILKNGEEIFKTNQTNFSVNANDGDTIQVKSKNACQGEMEKKVNFLENIKAYPNPSNGKFEIFVPNSTLNSVNIELYNIRSQLLEKKNNQLTLGSITLNIEDKPNGVYFVKIYLTKPIFIKLVKR